MPKIAKKKTQSRKTLAREGMAEMIEETSTCGEVVGDGGGRWCGRLRAARAMRGWQHARL